MTSRRLQTTVAPYFSLARAESARFGPIRLQREGLAKSATLSISKDKNAIDTCFALAHRLAQGRTPILDATRERQSPRTGKQGVHTDAGCAALGGIVESTWFRTHLERAK